MPFSETERQRMLEVKFVGKTVLQRLEELGFSQLSELNAENASDLTLKISKHIGSTCWHNSPQARASIQGLIDLAAQVSP
jgi:hypothetical protein